MRYAEGSGESIGARRILRQFFVFCLVCASCTFMPHITRAVIVIYTASFQAVYGDVTIYNGNPINPRVPPTPASIDGSTLTANDSVWTIQQRFEPPQHVDAPNEVYVLERVDPTTHQLEGGTPRRGVNYDVVHVSFDYSIASTNVVTFSMPPLGAAATPSGTYELLGISLPATKTSIDPITGNTITSDVTDDDIGAYVSGNYNFTLSAAYKTVPAEFNYISGAAKVGCTQNCYSNVLFLPGIESSQLYTKSSGSENQLWQPGFLSHQSDVQALDLDVNGTSLNPVYTKANGAIDTITYGLYHLDIYKDFLIQLSNLKASTTINDFIAFPYDWRMSPDDVVTNGVAYDDGTHYLDQTITNLASSSKSGKVTIVAHSNGGLVAKALMIKLQQEGKANLIDKVILVDVPQLGTPMTIASMLNGDDNPFPGFVVSQATGRNLAENMPDAYDLLPSPSYFASVLSPVVDVTNAPSLKNSSNVPNVISDNVNFAKFLTTGRQQPPASDIETPAALSSTQLLKANLLHAQLDSWTPPAGVQVIQIAGWGIDTPSGVVYSEQQEYSCILFICQTSTTTRHTVNLTEDGDDTVVSPSDVATSSWTTYFLNLSKYQADTQSRFRHKNVMSFPPFLDLFTSLLATSSPQVFSKYITFEKPEASSLDKSIRLRVLSPVTLDAYDSFGNHTGMATNPNPNSDDLYVEEQIPGSYYQRYGEGQYIGLPADGNYQIKLHGTDTGTFTFEVTPVTGGVASTPVSFTDVPVTASSTATINLDSSTPASTTLALDVNGDGVQDVLIASSSQTTDPLAYAKLVKTSIANMDIGAPVQKQLQAKFTNIIYLLTKSDQWDDTDDDGKDTSKADKLNLRVIKKINKVESYVQKEIGKPVSKRNKDERITQSQATAVLDMLEELKNLVNVKI